MSSKTSHCSSLRSPRIALQRVVQELGGVEELLLAEDHVPVGVEADVAHQRHDRVEDLRDAAAEGGGADVEDALALRAARPARGSRSIRPCRRCACSRRATSGRGRLPEARLRQATAFFGGRRRPVQPARLVRALARASRRRLIVLPSRMIVERHRVARVERRRGRARSSRLHDLVAVDREDHVAAGLESAPWKRIVSSPPWRPAFSAGPPGTTSESRPPWSVSRPSLSASCG